LDNEEIYREAMKELEKALEDLKKSNFDFYLKTLGEIEKDLRKYLFKDKE
jgi:hypothetical protein